MSFLRQHWFDVGIVLAFIVGISLAFTTVSPLSFLLWINLFALFLHQFEEYRYPGYFPGMINLVIFASKQPDRYPLNSNTAFIVNAVLGWFTYFLAAAFGEKFIWVGIAVILISVGNVFAHSFLFNIKGKTFYNPGLLTAVLLFLPIAAYFFFLIIQKDLATPLDWIWGAGLGMALNYIGILKMIDWLKDEKTTHIFPKRCLPPTIE